RKWSELATMRFETEPGAQAQDDYGQLKVWIGEQPETVHLFVFTLGYSRRLFTRGYRNERLATLLDGHERALRHFGGVTLTCLYDNPRTLVLGRSENRVLWHPLFEDFARYYGFAPRACQPYRARTKGKVESGVKYVKRNALAGRRFSSWEELNGCLGDRVQRFSHPRDSSEKNLGMTRPCDGTLRDFSGDAGLYSIPAKIVAVRRNRELVAQCNLRTSASRDFYFDSHCR